MISVNVSFGPSRDQDNSQLALPHHLVKANSAFGTDSSFDISEKLQLQTYFTYQMLLLNIDSNKKPHAADGTGRQTNPEAHVCCRIRLSWVRAV